MEHCYWNHTGKYQALADELSTKAPDIGYTSNKYMNLYLAMTHLYYDAYNNGGCNIVDCYANDVRTKVFRLLPDISARPFVLCEYQAMEQAMDRALEYLQDKDFSFPTYVVWLNHKQGLLSQIQPSDTADWTVMTFGDKERRSSYCLRQTRSGDYRDVTEEIRNSKENHPSLDVVIQNAKTASVNNPPAKSLQPDGR